MTLLVTVLYLFTNASQELSFRNINGGLKPLFPKTKRKETNEWKSCTVRYSTKDPSVPLFLLIIESLGGGDVYNWLN